MARKSVILLLGIAACIAIIALYFLFAVIGIGGGENNLTIYLLDTIFGAQVIVLLLVGLLATAFGLVKNKSLAVVGASLLISVMLVLIPAAIIQQTHYYYRGGEGGPSGAEFDCLVWDNPYSYFSLQFEATCTLMHIPSLNTAILSTRESYSLESGPAYWLTIFVSQTLLICIPYKTSKRLRNKQHHTIAK